MVAYKRRWPDFNGSGKNLLVLGTLVGEGVVKLEMENSQVFSL